MNILCVIPARSGSKGVANKNIKDFDGKPLIVHSIEYAKNCKEISDIVVSTDSIEYSKIAEKYGALVPFIRPKKFSTDTSQDIDFIYHALINCEKIYKKKYSLVILLRPTSPIRENSLIKKGLDMMIADPRASSLKAVTEAIEHPYRHWIPEDKYIVGYEKRFFEPYNLPRQKLPKTFYSAGDLEIIRRNTIIEGSVSGNKIIPLILNKEEVVDIDTPSDWKKAEEILKFKKTKK
jgi:N-acylneuraminate cytidylyltransferase